MTCGITEARRLSHHVKVRSFWQKLDIKGSPHTRTAFRWTRSRKEKALDEAPPHTLLQYSNGYAYYWEWRIEWIRGNGFRNFESAITNWGTIAVGAGCFGIGKIIAFFYEKGSFLIIGKWKDNLICGLTLKYTVLGRQVDCRRYRDVWKHSG